MHGDGGLRCVVGGVGCCMITRGRMVGLCFFCEG